MTPAEREQLNVWRSSSADREGAYQRALTTWRLSGELAGDPKIEMELADLRRHRSRPEYGARRRWFAYAATLVVASTALLFWWLQSSMSATYATRVGERREIALPDGSTLAMATNTSVALRYTPLRRRLTLRQGEIQVDVAAQRFRRFEVAAGRGIIEAVGTRFNVIFESGVVTVTLLEGHTKVRIASARSAVLLQQGASFAYDLNGTPRQADRRTASVARIEGWRSGFWEFEGWTVEEAVREHNRYSTRPVVLASDAAGNERITGRFRIGETHTFVAAVSAATGGSSVETPDQIVLLPRQVSANGAPLR